MTGAGMATRPRISWVWLALAPWLIAATGVMAYVNTFGNPFLFDDLYVAAIRPEWPRILSWLNPRGLVVFTFLLNAFADGANPAGYHAVNLAIHILAALLLYGVVRRTADRFFMVGWTPALSRGVALVSALLWVAHPLQTESVSYVSQRYESLMGAMVLLTLYGFVRASGSSKPTVWLAVSVASCWMGMGTKETMVVTPLLVLLYDVTFGSEGWRGALRHWRYHGLLVLSWAFLSFLRSHAVGDATAGGYAIEYPAVPAHVYLVTQGPVILRYLRLAFLPTGLCLDYAWLPVESIRSVLPSITALVVLGLLTLAGLRRRHPLGFLGAWFFLTLAPTSSVLPLHDLAFEHRMYLPLAAVVVFAVAGGANAVVKWGGASRRSLLWVGGGVAAAAVLGLAAATIQRNRVYASPETMWRDVLRKAPHNLRQRVALASSLNKEGRHREAELEARQLVDHMRAVRRSGVRPRHLIAATDPDVLYPEALQQLGLSLLGRGEVQGAVDCFREAVLLVPTRRSRHNLSLALMRDGNLEEAIQELDLATADGSGNALSWAFKGHLLSQVGRFHEAIRSYERALECDPRLLTARIELAWLLATCPDDTVRDGKRAVQLGEAALAETGATSSRVFDVLAAAYAEAGRFDDAVNACAKALALLTGADVVVRATGDEADGLERARMGSLEAELRARSAAYATGHPFRDVPSSDPDPSM